MTHGRVHHPRLSSPKADAQIHMYDTKSPRDLTGLCKVAMLVLDQTKSSVNSTYDMTKYGPELTMILSLVSYFWFQSAAASNCLTSRSHYRLDPWWERRGERVWRTGKTRSNKEREDIPPAKKTTARYDNPCSCTRPMREQPHRSLVIPEKYHESNRTKNNNNNNHNSRQFGKFWKESRHPKIMIHIVINIPTISWHVLRCCETRRYLFYSCFPPSYFSIKGNYGTFGT